MLERTRSNLIDVPGPSRLRCLMAVLGGLLVAAGSAAAGGPGLWVPNTQSLSEFQGKLKSGPARAHRIYRSSNLDGSSSIAFDRNGNLWVTNFNDNTVVQFTKKQLTKTKKKALPSAAVIISEDPGSNLDGPEGLAFDGSGNMWVGAEHGQQILVYTPAQYAVSGNPTPNVILNANSFSFSSPSNVVFDAAGNLWVVDENIVSGNGGHGEVFKYTKAQITGLTAGTHNIDPVFGIASQYFVHLEGLAFDRSGNMWLADELGVNMYQFSASQLTGTGLSQNLTPAVILSPTSVAGSCTKSLDGPYGVAVDQNGNLFVSNANVSGQCAGSLAVFSAQSIQSTGNPVPIVFMSSDAAGTSIHDPNYLTFGPSVP